MTNSTFDSNVASNYFGGGAIDSGSSATYLSVSGTAFSRNQADAGGAVAVNSGTTTFEADTFTANTGCQAYCDYQGSGGAIYDGVGVTIDGSTFIGNVAGSASQPDSDGSGGAYYYERFCEYPYTSTVTNSLFSGNIAGGGTGSQGFGGAIAVIDAATLLAGDTFENNTTTSAGGGIDVDYSTVTVVNSTIAGNQVTAADEGGGGGIYNDGELEVVGSLISGNSVSGSSGGGGGIYNGDEGNSLTIQNSTITLNSSHIDGGGLENENSGVSLTNVTFYKNSANSTSGNGGNLYNEGTIALANSIVAGGTAFSGPDINGDDGEIDSGDYNIVETPMVDGFTPAAHDLIGTAGAPVNPLLLPLAGNGGPTQTDADQATSPGTGYIPFSACSADGITVDQRSYRRGIYGTCDVGAYELDGTPYSAIRAPRGERHQTPNAYSR